MNVLEIESIAKINLGLIIKEKREDGYHNLETIFYPLNDIYDTLVFEKSETDAFSANVDLPFDESNLIYRAKLLLEEKSGKRMPVKVTLNKKIPMGGGLGGGSSNAAATLIALDELFNLDIPRKTLAETALSLGSDVPFFLYSKPAFAESRGEILTPVKLKIPGFLVLVNPGIHVSTKEAFANIIPSRSRKLDVGEIVNSVNHNFEHAKELIRNDFEPYVFRRFPEIGRIKEFAEEQGALFAAMSGTGSTVYAIFENRKDAEKFAAYYFEKNFLVLFSEKHG